MPQLGVAGDNRIQLFVCVPVESPLNECVFLVGQLYLLEAGKQVTHAADSRRGTSARALQAKVVGLARSRTLCRHSIAPVDRCPTAAAMPTTYPVPSAPYSRGTSRTLSPQRRGNHDSRTMAGPCAAGSRGAAAGTVCATCRGNRGPREEDRSRGRGGEGAPTSRRCAATHGRPRSDSDSLAQAAVKARPVSRRCRTLRCEGAAATALVDNLKSAGVARAKYGASRSGSSKLREQRLLPTVIACRDRVIGVIA